MDSVFVFPEAGCDKGMAILGRRPGPADSSTSRLPLLDMRPKDCGSAMGFSGRPLTPENSRIWFGE